MQPIFPHSGAAHPAGSNIPNKYESTRPPPIEFRAIGTFVPDYSTRGKPIPKPATSPEGSDLPSSTNSDSNSGNNPPRPDLSRTPISAMECETLIIDGHRFMIPAVHLHDAFQAIRVRMLSAFHAITSGVGTPRDLAFIFGRAEPCVRKIRSDMESTKSTPNTETAHTGIAVVTAGNLQVKQVREPLRESAQSAKEPPRRRSLPITTSLQDIGVKERERPLPAEVRAPTKCLSARPALTVAGEISQQRGSKKLPPETSKTMPQTPEVPKEISRVLAGISESASQGSKALQTSRYRLQNSTVIARGAKDAMRSTRDSIWHSDSTDLEEPGTTKEQSQRSSRRGAPGREKEGLLSGPGAPKVLPTRNSARQASAVQEGIPGPSDISSAMALLFQNDSGEATSSQSRAQPIISSHERSSPYKQAPVAHSLEVEAPSSNLGEIRVLETGLERSEEAVRCATKLKDVIDLIDDDNAHDNVSALGSPPALGPTEARKITAKYRSKDDLVRLMSSGGQALKMSHDDFPKFACETRVHETEATADLIEDVLPEADLSLRLGNKITTPFLSTNRDSTPDNPIPAQTKAPPLDSQSLSIIPETTSTSTYGPDTGISAFSVVKRKETRGRKRKSVTNPTQVTTMVENNPISRGNEPVMPHLLRQDKSSKVKLGSIKRVETRGRKKKVPAVSTSESNKVKSCSDAGIGAGRAAFVGPVAGIVGTSGSTVPGTIRKETRGRKPKKRVEAAAEGSDISPLLQPAAQAALPTTAIAPQAETSCLSPAAATAEKDTGYGREEARGSRSQDGERNMKEGLRIMAVKNTHHKIKERSIETINDTIKLKPTRHRGNREVDTPSTRQIERAPKRLRLTPTPLWDEDKDTSPGVSWHNTEASGAGGRILNEEQASISNSRTGRESSKLTDQQAEESTGSPQDHDLRRSERQRRAPDLYEPTTQIRDYSGPTRRRRARTTRLLGFN